jgi:hypothetical protein
MSEFAPLAITTEPRTCPRYGTCSAPVCPFDRDWQNRNHLPKDRVCRWLTELAKPGGNRVLRVYLVEEQARRVSEVAPDIAASTAYIRRSVRRAAETPSKIESDRARMAKARSSQRESPENDVLKGPNL